MGWFSSDESENKKLPVLPAWMSDYVTINSIVPPEMSQEFRNVSPTQAAAVAVACTASFALGWRFAKVGASFRRMTAVSDVHSNHIGADAPWLRGRVVSVSDGDTIRLLHVPTRFHSSRLGEGEKLSENALAIRICTIDTPETSKFGKEGQAYGEEAKSHLRSMILDRMVQIKLLQKDQYGRGVAEVKRRGPLLGFPTKYMDQEMLKAGLAEVYQGGGAVYGYKGKDYYLGLERIARDNKTGMWSQKNRESAAEYKKRMKAE